MDKMSCYLSLTRPLFFSVFLSLSNPRQFKSDMSYLVQTWLKVGQDQAKTNRTTSNKLRCIIDKVNPDFVKIEPGLR